MTPKTTAPTQSGGRPGPTSRPSSSCHAEGAGVTPPSAESGPTNSRPGAEISCRPPGQQNDQRHSERDADAADLARAAPQHNRSEDPDNQRKDDHGGFEGDEGYKHHSGTPAAAPRLRGSRPAQYQRPRRHDQQRQADGDHTEREPALIRATEQHWKQRVRAADPEPYSAVVDHAPRERIRRQQRQRHDATQQQRGEPFRLAEHGR